MQAVTIITETTPTAGGKITLASRSGNSAAKYRYSDFKSSSWYIDPSSELCSRLHGRAWEYVVNGVEAHVAIEPMLVEASFQYLLHWQKLLGFLTLLVLN